MIDELEYVRQARPDIPCATDAAVRAARAALDRAIAADRSPPRRLRLPLGLPDLGAAIRVTAALGAALIAVAAIVVIGRRAPTLRSAGVPPFVSRLEKQFAVLRRPQTAADRVDIGPWLAQLEHPPVVYLHSVISVTGFSSYAKVVKRERMSITFFVATVIVREIPRSLQGPAVFFDIPGLPPQNLWSTLPNRGQNQYLRVGDRLVGIVPDGVARVRWTWARGIDPTSGFPRPWRWVDAQVNDNVAIARTSIRGYPYTVTWYSATGRKLYRFGVPTP